MMRTGTIHKYSFLSFFGIFFSENGHFIDKKWQAW